VQRLDANELRRAFRVAVSALLAEMRLVNEPLAVRLKGALTELAAM
jgi:hypothetical protein